MPDTITLLSMARAAIPYAMVVRCLLIRCAGCGGTSGQDITVNQKTSLIVNTVHAKSNHLEGNSELHHVEDLGVSYLIATR
jgi:hypothetical protein